ncbi:MAG: type II toxin-antitoxin system prevent-host-death family antitoxin [Clostridia bacterium]|nr:type II toxin-antitoxin system prevent-host-death family antitoxin [Clostridia bacterium]
MSITLAELEKNPTKYILLSAKEDVYIVTESNITLKLVNPNQERIDAAKSLFGILAGDTTTLEEARDERLSKI